MSLTRYRVEEPVKDGFWEYADQRLRSFSFKDIENSTDELSFGWVSVGDFLDTGFAYASYALEPYLLAGLRVDRRQVAAALLRKYHRLEIRKTVAAREGARLDRAQREECKERARLGLLQRIPPSSQLFEVAWDTLSGEVWLGSATGWVREIFQDLFERTFERLLTPHALWQAAPEKWSQGSGRALVEKAMPLDLAEEA